MKKTFEKLEEKIGVEFKNKDLLENVFVHRSYLNEHKSFHLPSNEKLEFLGDSVLSLITSMYLYNNYPQFEEGSYTDIKSAIVRTESLAYAASPLGLGEYLYLSRGEEQGAGRDNKNILADCFEALIGAIFIDQGFDASYEFVKTYLFADRLDEIISTRQYAPAKSLLQETMQSIHKTTPEYRVIAEEGPQHKRAFTIAVYLGQKLLAEGRGNSKKEAEEQAARLALEKMNKSGRI